MTMSIPSGLRASQNCSKLKAYTLLNVLLYYYYHIIQVVNGRSPLMGTRIHISSLTAGTSMK